MPVRLRRVQSRRFGRPDLTPPRSVRDDRAFWGGVTIDAFELRVTRTRIIAGVRSKVVITVGAEHDGAARTEEHVSFLIDDAAKTLTLSDGRQLRFTRLEKSWIGANNDDIQYKFNRGDGTLTYAGSTTEGSTITTVIGSGSCEDASTEKT
jgi:hypothetical protein